MCRVERKAGEGSKRRDVFLVRISSTFTNCNVFVDEFVDARLLESGKGKTTQSCLRTESAILLCLAFCFKHAFSLQDFSATVEIQ